MAKIIIRQILGIALILLGVIFWFLPFSPGWLLIFGGLYLIFGKEFTEKVKRFLKRK